MNTAIDADWQRTIPGRVTRIDRELGEVTVKFDPELAWLHWLECGWDVTVVPDHYKRAEGA